MKSVKVKAFVLVSLSLVIFTVIHEMIHIVLILTLEPNLIIKEIHILDLYSLKRNRLGTVIVEGQMIVPLFVHEIVAYSLSFLVILIYYEIVFRYLKREMEYEIHKQRIS